MLNHRTDKPFSVFPKSALFTAILIFLLSLSALFGCSSSASDKGKLSALKYINSVWQRHMEARSGSLTQNTEWTIGNETSKGGMYIEFCQKASGFSFTAEVYRSFADDTAKPYEKISVSDSGDFLIIDNEEVGFSFNRPLDEPPSLSQFFERIGETPDASDIENIETVNQDGNTVYRLIFTPEYCQSQSSETGGASSVLYSKTAEISITPDGNIQALTYSTEGGIRTGSEGTAMGETEGMMEENGIINGNGDRDGEETPVRMDTQFLFDFDI